MGAHLPPLDSADSRARDSASGSPKRLAAQAECLAPALKRGTVRRLSQHLTSHATDYRDSHPGRQGQIWHR